MGYDQIVLNPSLNVLVQFHAPWCGRCAAQNPELQDVTRWYKDDPTVLVGTLNAMDNEVLWPEEFQLPTIVFFAANASTLQDGRIYEGGASSAEIVTFVDKHRSTLPSGIAKDEL